MSINLPPAPDYLEGGGGPTDPPRRGRGRRIALVGGGAAVIALVGGGVWAWNFWFSQGPQPSEALPADTLAYVAVDLDPSGEQQIEAVETLRKFDVLEEEFDFDLGARDDIKKWIFEKSQDEDGFCEELSYDEDLKSWLGDRFAFAVVEVDEQPQPVGVLQVKDADEAAEGIDALLECGLSDEDEPAGWAVEGDWLVLAETEEIAKDVLDAGQEDPLSDDADFQELTGEAGDPGVVTMYVAPGAGKVLIEEVGDEFLAGFSEGAGGGEAGDALAEEFGEAVEAFPGAAATLRFEDGDVEFEAATGQLGEDTLSLFGPGEGIAGDVVAGLPDTTVGAIGYSFPDGWAADVLELLTPMIEEESGMPIEEALATIEQNTGLTIPEDVETLVGDAIAVAVDSSIDADAFEEEDPALVPAGVRIKGDADEIEAVLDDLRAHLGPEVAGYLHSERDGDHVVVALNEEYLDTLTEGGELGDDPAFRDVLEHADEAVVVYFLDFDSENWLVELFEETGEDEIARNVEPLSAFGLNTWYENDELHVQVKLTTD